MTRTKFFTVRAFGVVSLDHVAAITSLPGDLRLHSAGPVDIALVQPRRAALVEALDAAPRAIVLDRPADLDTSLLELLDRTVAPVLPVLKLAASLRLIDASRPLAASGLIRSRLRSAQSLNEAILEHLAGLTAILGSLSDVRMLGMSANSYAATARTKGHAEVTWSGQANATNPDYELDIVGLEARLEVTGVVDGSARPLLVRLGTAEGLAQPPGVFETGLRLFWRSVAGALFDGAPVPRWPATKGLLNLVNTLSLANAHPTGNAA
jgi:hypothetical protein